MLFKAAATAFALLLNLSATLAAPIEVIALDPDSALYRQSPNWAAQEGACLRIKGSYDFPAQLLHADIYDGPLHVCGVHQFFNWYDMMVTDRIIFDCMAGYRASISRDLSELFYTIPMWAPGQKNKYRQFWHDTWDMELGSRSHREFVVSEQRTDTCMRSLGYIDASKYGTNEGRDVFRFKDTPAP